MDKKGYHKLQAQARRESSDMLQRFRELYPEKYAELLAKAKQEVNEPTPERPVVKYTIPKRSLNIDALHTEPHYYIHTKDAFGDEHLLFESGYTPEAAALKGQERWGSRYAHKIVRIEKCSCPLCVHQ